jgi:hypothetical protein
MNLRTLLSGRERSAGGGRAVVWSLGRGRTLRVSESEFHGVATRGALGYNCCAPRARRDRSGQHCRRRDLGVHASARLPGWVVPKSSVEIEALLDSLAMPSCWRCGAITDGVDPVCYPCRSGNRTVPPYGSRRATHLRAEPALGSAAPSAQAEALGTSAPPRSHRARVLP